MPTPWKTTISVFVPLQAGFQKNSESKGEKTGSEAFLLQKIFTLQYWQKQTVSVDAIIAMKIWTQVFSSAYYLAGFKANMCSTFLVIYFILESQKWVNSIAWGTSYSPVVVLKWAAKHTQDLNQ